MRINCGTLIHRAQREAAYVGVATHGGEPMRHRYTPWYTAVAVILAVAGAVAAEPIQHEENPFAEILAGSRRTMWACLQGMPQPSLHVAWRADPPSAPTLKYLIEQLGLVGIIPTATRESQEPFGQDLEGLSRPILHIIFTEGQLMAQLEADVTTNWGHQLPMYIVTDQSAGEPLSAIDQLVGRMLRHRRAP